MENQFISLATIEMLNRLVQRMFLHNRILDRGLSVLNVEFVMHNFESIYHSGMAHKYPLLADSISSILTDYNITTKYYDTPSDESGYTTPLDFFDKNLELHSSTYSLIKEAIDTSVENGDINVESELKNFMRTFNKYIAQSILLKDKAKSFGNNYALFDAFAEQFYILDK